MKLQKLDTYKKPVKKKKKPNINTNPQPLHRFKIPPGFVLLQDTREQKPLFNRPPQGLVVVTCTLHDGDYSIQGFKDKFCIERKQMSDFYGYIASEREKTVRKMRRFRDIVNNGGFVGLVIEATEEEVLSGFMFSQVPPEVARQAIVSFEIRYGVHVYYSDDRRNIARWIMDRAIKYYKVSREVN